MKKIMNNEEARELLSAVGSSPTLENDVQYDMELVVLTKIYGCIPGFSCAETRAQKWRKQSKKNTINLPPDADSLYFNLKRVNYLTYCMRNFCLRAHPNPIGNGWEQKNNTTRSVRSSLPALSNLSNKNIQPIEGSDTVTLRDR